MVEKKYIYIKQECRCFLSLDFFNMDAGEVETVLQSKTSKAELYFAIMDTKSSGQKRRGTFQLLISTQFKTSTDDGVEVHQCSQFWQLAAFFFCF